MTTEDLDSQTLQSGMPFEDAVLIHCCVKISFLKMQRTYFSVSRSYSLLISYCPQHFLAEESHTIIGLRRVSLSLSFLRGGVCILRDFEWFYKNFYLVLIFLCYYCYMKAFL